MRFKKAVHVSGRTQIRDRLRFFVFCYSILLFFRFLSGKFPGIELGKKVPEPFRIRDLLEDEFGLTRVLSCTRVSVK